MIKCVEIELGYAESSQLSSLLFIHSEGFDSPKKALESLADELYQEYAFYFGLIPNQRSCCKEQLKFNYCPQCGKKRKTFDLDDYINWIKELPVATPYRIDYSEGWNHWVRLSDILKLTPDQILTVTDNGQLLLVRASKKLREDYPDPDWEDRLREYGCMPSSHTGLLEK